MKKYVVSIFLVLVILLIPSMVYASHESHPNLEEDESCIFTAYIEKSWISFPDDPWVSGFVYNCDSNEYHEKDRVFVRVLDINGDLVEDNWLPKNPTNKDEIVSQYVFTEHVYRKGSFTGNANVESVEVIHIKPNQYFFYMPQINSVDFEHRGIYQIELTYGDHVRTIWFATFSPDIWWENDEVAEEDPCIDYKDKIIRLNNTLDVLERELFRFDLNGQIEKYENTLKVLEDTEKQIEELEKCHV